MADDYINADQHVWNAEGELWNEDNPPQIVTRFLKPLPEEGVTLSQPRPRPDVVTEFDPAFDKPVQAIAQGSPRRTIFAGNYAAIRAMRTAHQHRVNFWADEGPIRLFTESDSPDPTTEQLDQHYSDLRLFSYLPDSLMPTRREFEDLARPQRRLAATRAQLTKVGVVTGAQRETETNNLDDRLQVNASLPLLPRRVPFSGNLANFCAERIRDIIQG